MEAKSIASESEAKRIVKSLMTSTSKPLLANSPASIPPKKQPAFRPASVPAPVEPSPPPVKLKSKKRDGLDERLIRASCSSARTSLEFQEGRVLLMDHNSDGVRRVSGERCKDFEERSFVLSVLTPRISSLEHVVKKSVAPPSSIATKEDSSDNDDDDIFGDAGTDYKPTTVKPRRDHQEEKVVSRHLASVDEYDASILGAEQISQQFSHVIQEFSSDDDDDMFASNNAQDTIMKGPEDFASVEAWELYKESMKLRVRMGVQKLDESQFYKGKGRGRGDLSPGEEQQRAARRMGMDMQEIDNIMKRKYGAGFKGDKKDAKKPKVDK